MKTQCFILAALAAAPCFAQNPSPSTLDPLVVTATRSEQRLSDVAASIHVITRQDIERAQANDLADLLRTVAGVDVARSGGPGSPASVFIRGADSNHTLFLVDGVRYTTETFFNAQIQNLAPEMIERIEIVKGPRSALWGSDAIGGVVQIVTRRAQRGVQAGGSLRAGSFGTRDLAGFVGYGGSAGEIGLNLEWQDFDGFAPRQSGSEDRGHENLNAVLNSSLALGPAQLGLRHLQAEGANEYVAAFGGAPLSQDFQNRVSAVELSAALSHAWRSKLTASLAYDELVQREPSDPARPQAFDFTEVERRGLEWENVVTAGAVALTGGLATSSSELDNAFFSAFGDSTTQARSERHAAFAQAQGAVLGLDALVGGRYTDHSQFGAHTVGQAELARAVGATRLGLAYGTAFKEPELTDLHGSFGNPDLDPERSATLELNLRQRLALSQVLTASVFETRIRDLIAFDFSTFKPANTERARIRGVEAGWRYEGGRWNAWLSGNWQEALNSDTGARLLRRSRESAQAGVGRSFGPLHAQLEALAHGSRKDLGNARLAGYALLNAAVSYSPLQRWSLSLRGENLLDKDYELVDGFRTPRSSGYVTLRANF